LEPNLLFVDGETSALLVYAWGLGKQDIDYKRIYKERQVLCIGYAFNDLPVNILTTNYDMFSIHNRDDDADKEMLQEFSDLCAQADLVIGHNIKQFDVGVLRSRIIKHGLPDLPPFLIDDTYIQTKGIGFTSHRLDYLTQYLGIGRKEDHPFEMWVDVMNKVPGAFEKMQTYCKGDVENNRKMYKRLLPYITSTLNLGVYHEREDICRYCGSTELHPRKYRYTPTGKYTQFRCGNCGKYSTSGHNLLTKSGNYLR
jgi:DNA polymerase elongation subunit (family B)